MQMAMDWKIAICLFCLVSSLKILLFPSYHSTDFEVHRNWLAITHSLSIEKWYFSETSPWSLDYPPFFAYFEWCLAHVAALVDANIVKIESLNLASQSTIYFQRSSVVVVDAVLALATYRFLQSSKTIHISVGIAPSSTLSSALQDAENDCNSRSLLVYLLVIFNAGLLLVDHIHFQYNGLLLGILVLCLDCANRKHYKTLTLLYSVLVLMKHLFVPLAPVFGVYLLATHCFVGSSSSSDAPESSKQSVSLIKSGTNRSYFSIFRLLQLVIIACVALVAAFAPFLLSANSQQYFALSQQTLRQFLDGEMPLYLVQKPLEVFGHVLPAELIHQQNQLIRIAMQLFPFGRGLVHAYWAPNVWALYCMLDKVLQSIIPKYFIEYSYLLSTKQATFPASTSGIVGDFQFSVLPSVPPHICLILTFVLQLPALFKLFRDPTPKRLLDSVVYCSLCAFMVGYHVHEKAIIIPILVQSLTMFDDASHAYLLMLLVGPGFVGLFPLFSELPELVLKWALVLTYVACISWSVYVFSPIRKLATSWIITVFIVLVGLTIFCEVIHPLYFVNQLTHEKILPFLPCMATSVICASFLGLAWIYSFVIVTMHG